MHARTWTWALLLGAIGCAEPTPDARPRPTAYTPGPGAEGALASVSPDDAAALVADLVALAAAYRPAQVFAIHDALLAHGDATCPTIEDLDAEPDASSRYWEGYCTSQDGTRFEGAVQITTVSGAEPGFVLLSDGPFSIHAPDGRFLRGTTYMEAGGSPDDSYAYAAGFVESDGASAGGDVWLEGTIRGSLDVGGYDDGDARVAYVNAALALPYHPRISAVQLRELVVEDGACVSGEVALRVPDGGWHEASFGAAEDGACDTCAELFFGGTSLGSFCNAAADFDALLSWEAQP
jgi:hypothetical protein